MTWNCCFFPRGDIAIEDGPELDLTLIWIQIAGDAFIFILQVLFDDIRDFCVLRALDHMGIEVEHCRKKQCGDIYVVHWFLIHLNSFKSEKKSCHVPKRFHVVSGN